MTPFEQMPTDQTLLLQQILTHMNIMNGELGDVLQRISALETQMDNLLWMNRLVMGIVITAIVGALLALILKVRKNGKKQ